MGMTRRQRSRRLRPRRCLPRSPPRSPRQALVTLAGAPPPGNLLPELPAVAPEPPAAVVPVLPAVAPEPPAAVVPALPAVAPEPPAAVVPVLPAVAPEPPAAVVPALPAVAPGPSAAVVPALPAVAPGPPAAVAPGPAVVVPGPLLRVRQNYHANCEAAINNQINLELYASYVYLSIAFYFDRQSTASKHFATFFLWQSREEREQAQALMRLQNQRRGRLRLRDVRRPDRSQWESGLRAMKSALHVERIVNQSLLSLLHLATDESDVHLCDFLKRHHLRQDVEFINNFGVSIIQLRKLGAPESSLAEYLFDTLTLGASMKN